MRTPDSLSQNLSNRFVRDNADATVISFPKCGRTWLSLMSTTYIARSIGHPDLGGLSPTGQLRSLVPERERDYVRAVVKARQNGAEVPLLIFLHKVDYHAPYFLPQRPSSKTERNVVLLRDPRDVVVSFYYHVVHKSEGRVPGKPPSYLSPQTSLAEFIYSDCLGFRKILRYMAEWSAWAADHGAVIYFEDLVADTAGTLARFLRDIGVSPGDDALVRSVAAEHNFSAVRDAERAMAPERVDPKLSRMRKGRVGGYVDEVDEREVAFMAAALAEANCPALERYLAADGAL